MRMFIYLFFTCSDFNLNLSLGSLDFEISRNRVCPFWTGPLCIDSTLSTGTTICSGVIIPRIEAADDAVVYNKIC